MHPSTAARHRTITGSIARWWRNWWKKRARLLELARCGEEEAARIACDVGVTGRELEALAGRGPDSANLLYRRMNGLHLNATAVARSDRLLLRDLQRVCSMCESKRRCEQDLDRDLSGPGWQSYCPNTDTFKALTMEADVERALKRDERQRRRRAVSAR